MNNDSPTENDLRALAAVRFFGGFEVQGKRDDCLARLYALGWATAGFQHVAPAAPTKLGERILQRTYLSALSKSEPDRTPFERDLCNAMSRAAAADWASYSFSDDKPGKWIH